MTYFLITVAVIVLLAIAGLFIFLKLRKREARQLVCLVGNTTISMKSLPRDRSTVRDGRDSFFLDVDAYRQRASRGNKILQFVFSDVATPFYPGESVHYRDEKVKAHAAMLSSIAEEWADYDLENAQKSETRARQYALYKMIAAGSVVIVLIISVLTLVMSGKIHNPF